MVSSAVIRNRFLKKGIGRSKSNGTALTFIQYVYIGFQRYSAPLKAIRRIMSTKETPLVRLIALRRWLNNYSIVISQQMYNIALTPL